jgi:hypothetical protein
MLEWDVAPRLRSVPGVIEVNALGGAAQAVRGRARPARLAAHGSRSAAGARGARAQQRQRRRRLDRARRRAVRHPRRGAAAHARGPRLVVVATTRRHARLDRHLGEVRVGAALPQGVVTQDGRGEVVSAHRDDARRGRTPARRARRARPHRGGRAHAARGGAGSTRSTTARSSSTGRWRPWATTCSRARCWSSWCCSLLLGSMRGSLLVTLGIPFAMLLAVFGMLAAGHGQPDVPRGHRLRVPGRRAHRDARGRDRAPRAARHQPEKYREAVAALGAPGRGRWCSRCDHPARVPPAALAGGSRGRCSARWPPPWPGAGRLGRLRAGGLPRRRGDLPAARRRSRGTTGCCTAWRRRIARRAVGARGARCGPSRRWPSRAGSHGAGGGASARTSSRASTRATSWWPSGASRASGSPRRAARPRDRAGARALPRGGDLARHDGPRGGRHSTRSAWTTPTSSCTSGPEASGPRARPRRARRADEDRHRARGPVDLRVDLAAHRGPHQRADLRLARRRRDPPLRRGPQVMTDIGNRIGQLMRRIRGAGDVRVERALGPPDAAGAGRPQRLARYGIAADDVLAAVEAARQGRRVGVIFEGKMRFDLRVLLPPPGAARRASALPVGTREGSAHPARAGRRRRPRRTGRADQPRGHAATTARRGEHPRPRPRELRRRSARRGSSARCGCPSGYRVEWSGQFENFSARERLGMVVPVSLAIIVAMLFLMFGNARYALAVFSGVPFALIGRHRRAQAALAWPSACPRRSGSSPSAASPCSTAS